VHLAEAAAPTPDRGPDRIDDEGFRHGSLLGELRRGRCGGRWCPRPGPAPRSA
jgi:hypothetical protein